ncbi:MAG: GNAT family N-acetyltransferase [Promethearchaeota archaeon]
MINDIDIIEEINDGTLYLRKITKDDSYFFFSNLNKKKSIPYLSLGPLNSLEESKRLIKRYLKYWERYAQYNYVIEIKETQTCKIGSISLWNVNWRNSRAEVGIWINPIDWNKGYGRRSLDLIKIIAFNHLKLNRLEAHIAIENQNSIRLFEGSGFKEEGILKQYLNLNGKVHDAVILAMLKTDLQIDYNKNDFSNKRN